MRITISCDQAARSLLTVCAVLCIKSNDAQSSSIDPEDYVSWIVKSVCDDGNGRAIPVDPFYSCSPGSTIRKLKPGEKIPYNNFEQV